MQLWFAGHALPRTAGAGARLDPRRLDGDLPAEAVELFEKAVTGLQDALIVGLVGVPHSRICPAARFNSTVGK